MCTIRTQIDTSNLSLSEIVSIESKTYHDSVTEHVVFSCTLEVLNDFLKIVQDFIEYPGCDLLLKNYMACQNCNIEIYNESPLYYYILNETSFPKKFQGLQLHDKCLTDGELWL